MASNLRALIKAIAKLGINVPELLKLATLQVMISKPSEYRFFDPTAVSCGWISPDGKYFYNGDEHYGMIETAYRHSYQDRAREIFTEQIKLAAPNEVDYNDVIDAMYKDAINSGWVKISNAFEISTGTPTRESLDAFVDLFLSYGNKEACERGGIGLLSSRYESLFYGDIFELESFAKSVGN